MLAVIICTLCNSALLLGLIGGLAAGLVRARGRIGEALAFDPLGETTSVAAAWRPQLRSA